MIPDIKKSFENIYNTPSTRIFFCPGRINLMGEHLDYNGGFVLPCAISLGTYLAISLRDDKEIHFHSLNLPESLIWNLNQTVQKAGKEWYNYPLGILKYVQELGIPLRGLNLLYGGNIPISSGLSSSASIEILTAFTFNELWSLKLSRMDMVFMAKKVENEFIGLQSGIMDQFSVSFGEKDQAILLNCQSLDYTLIPIKLEPYTLVIIGTNKARNLADSKYNERVIECNNALKALRPFIDLDYLSDLDLSTFLKYINEIKDPLEAKRSLHVISETNRVHQSVKALKNHDLSQFGEIMYASHDSLKNSYEVSGLELDTIVDYCRLDPTILGARMTGAGFGGCAIALVQSHSLEAFKKGLEKYYEEKVGYLPTLYPSDIGRGVHEVQ